MNKTLKKFLNLFAIAIAAVIILAGCQERNSKPPSAQKEVEIQISAPIDTAAMDEDRRFQIGLIKSTHSNTYMEK